MKNHHDPFFPDGLPGPGPGAGIDPSARLPVATGDAAPVRRRPPGVSAVPDALALLRALRYHWMLAFGLGLLGAGLAGAAAWRILPKPRYTASTLLEVKTNKPILLLETAQDKTDYKIFQSTQLALVRSRLVLNAALGRPGVAELPSVRTQLDPIDWLESEVVAEFPAGSELLKVSMVGDRPGDLAALVNAITDAYLDEIVSKDHNERLATSSKLKDLLDQYNDKLTKQRTKLKELAETVGSDDKQTLAMKQQLAVQQLAQEKSELLRVQSELKRSRVELSVLKESGLGEPRPFPESMVEEALAQEPTLERFKMQAAELSRKIERARRLVRSDSDPAVRALRKEHDAVQRAIFAKEAALRPKLERQLRNQNEDSQALRLTALETQVRVLAEYEKVLQQGINRLDVDAQAFNRQTIDLQWMKDEIAQGEETARRIGKEVEALNVELKAPQRVRVIERADSPRIESAKKRLAAIGLVAFCVFSCTVFGVSWREFRLRRVDTPDEVVDGLGLRLVGTLPALPAPGRTRGPNRWQNLLVESIDAARTMLLHNCRTDALRSIMITSASKGEGKSSLSSHLAISLARTGRQTLLVDFDLRSPSAHNLFDVPPGPGVCELLRGEAEVEGTAHTVMADLDVIPAGRCDAGAIRALAQDTLPALLARLTERYDFVVIDSAPVLPIADSLLISQHVDAVVLSVYREVSRLPAVYAGYERLAALGVRVLGAVVTGIPAERYGEEYHETSARGR